MAADRRFHKVVSTDYVSTLLAQAEELARAEFLALEF